jgi:hypothetical protein
MSELVVTHGPWLLDGKPEVWKDIEGWPFHQVSSWGRVRVLPGGRVKKRLVHKVELRKLTAQNTGYLTVGGRRQVHRLVLTAFHGPAHGRQSRHLNGDGHDNRLLNLLWGTRSENETDKVQHGRSNHGARNGQAKLSPADVAAIRNATGPRGLVTELAELHGVSHSTVSMIRAGMRCHDAEKEPQRREGADARGPLFR